MAQTISMSDPQIQRLDGTKFSFSGTPNTTYNLLTHAGLSISAALSGSGLVLHWGNFTLPAGGSVIRDEKNLTRISAGGWLVDCWLNTTGSEPHLDLYVLAQPADTSGATGLMVDGASGAVLANYIVTPPPTAGT